MLQPIVAGLVACLSGIAGSFALVIAGLQAVGASEQQAASGLFALALATGLLGVVVPVVTRTPISPAWSTPGAVVLIAAAEITDDFSAAVGAFLVSALLILLSGLWAPLGRAVTGIPRPIASAMLAGILFPICLVPVEVAVATPLLGLPIVLVWLVLLRLAPRWAVPAAMVVAVVGIALTTDGGWLRGDLLPAVAVVPPTFDPVVVLSLGVPLFLATMAGQNVPGFAVLETQGYRVRPALPLITTGAASGVAALAGGHAVNLGALTATIIAGPEAHPDPRRRWVAAVSAGAGYVVLAPFAGVAAAFVAASPPVLVQAVAGLAVLGALVSSIVAALADERARITAVVTFLVTASGVVVLGIGSALWGLVAGAIVYLWTVRRPRREAADA